jgi:hypothetical protein
MKLGSTKHSVVSVGFAEKDSPLYGYVKPVIQALLTALIMYFQTPDFGKGDMAAVVMVFMSALGLEAVNVVRKTTRG